MEGEGPKSYDFPGCGNAFAVSCVLYQSGPIYKPVLPVMAPVCVLGVRSDLRSGKCDARGEE